MIRYFVSAYLATLLTAVAHTLLKACAQRTLGRPFHALYTHPLGITAYLVFLAGTLFSLYAYTVLPLKYAALFMPANYIFIGLFAVCFLGERLTRTQWLGALVILLGVLVYGG